MRGHYVPEKVRCSINRKWFADENGNPSDKGRAVYAWCEDHNRPVPLFSAEDELQHDNQHHSY